MRLAEYGFWLTSFWSYRFVFVRGKWSMRKLTKFAVEFLKREDGPTAVEYAVMLALIIVVCIAAIATLGSNANLTFSKVGSAVGTTGS
jgi:pilus assembly protein Flp/PilA